MTYKEVADIIDSFGITTAYDHFDKIEDVKPPYICYYYLGDNDLYADNLNFQPIRAFNIDLYTDHKDFNLENRIEAELKLQNLSYSKDEEYIEEEKMYVITYKMQAVITE